jgi:hypothetical protein
MIWATDRLARQVLPHNVFCAFCNLDGEDIGHLLMNCSSIVIFWDLVFS